ncbi:MULTISPECIES: SDR family NAD(P)-dependent oxidoreductase [unclassified Streptomyces]|uniref:SDR family oxidoreductase n=1 Tax=unclassified Streptomyces TaxID=2593676 RepID=UPI002365F99E|nr:MULTISPECIES: SDR family NAD(P)-dependent oxidoreductase [unclassified Streptomyces]MDF3140510.1 SDR family NAD(P)-dependent oxidoreductase [Streptomyces sp. T21Q-yed]WDF36326.1 SDR family NAD(P)-dependent oxidoreductase [Streptomyces sp. T12]
MQDLAGRTAFITGGDSGIGFGVAQVLCHAGMNVVICGVVTETLASAQRELARIGRAEATQLDVRDREEFTAVADHLDLDYGGVDVLVNNAGVGFLAPVAEATFEQWDWVLDINLTGVFNGIRTFLPCMPASGRPGHIVSTASIGGLLGTPGALYVAAKFGVVGLMEALAAELRDTPVNVSVLTPGMVRTNIHNGPPPPGEPRPHTPGATAEAGLHETAIQPESASTEVMPNIRPSGAELVRAICAGLA